MNQPRLYLDHAATAPIHPAAVAAWQEAVALWANPSSPHHHGRAARAIVEDARKRIGEALGWDGEIIFTSGASEALALAMGQAKAQGRIVSAVEHDAVLRLVRKSGPANGAQTLAVDRDGRVDLDGLRQALSTEGDTGPLVAIQAVNSETGICQDLDQIGAIVRGAGAQLLVDCAQSAGKMPLPDADMLVVSAHKLGGPPGIGALLVRDLAALEPSGGQEKGYRGGTENMPAIAGFAAALEQSRNWLEQCAILRAHLDDAIRQGGGLVVGDQAKRLPTIAGYRMPGVSANAQLIQFDMAGISVSAGSACSSGTLKDSPVLTAMGWQAPASGEVIRVSIGPETSRTDIDRFLGVWQSIFARAAAA